MSALETLLGCTVLVLILAIYSIVGEMDLKDQERYSAVSCSMVERGIWPAYQVRNIDCATKASGETHE